MIREMRADTKIEALITDVFTRMMDAVIEDVLFSGSFVAEKSHRGTSIPSAFIPDEIGKGGFFERHFIVRLDNALKELAFVVAREVHGDSQSQKVISGLVKTGQLRRVSEILSRVEYSAGKSEEILKTDWSKEVEYIVQGRGNLIPLTITSDLFFDSKLTGRKCAFILAGQYATRAQIMVGAGKALKILGMKDVDVDEAYYVIPCKWCNVEGNVLNDSLSYHANRRSKSGGILMENDFWNMLGGEGTYQAIFSRISVISKAYRGRIFRDFLGVEPFSNGSENVGA